MNKQEIINNYTTEFFNNANLYGFVDVIWTTYFNEQFSHLTADILMEMLEAPPKGNIRHFIFMHPNCPPMARLWAEYRGFAGLSLTEFMEGLNND